MPDDDIEDVPAAVLVPSWERSPWPASSPAYGSAWARARRSLALRVPSAVVQQKRDLVVSCDHPRFAGLAIPDRGEPFRFDERLVRNR